MGSRHSVYAHGMRTARSAEQRGGCPEAACAECGRVCKVYWPTGGDGWVRLTFWHKDPATGAWCRSEVQEWSDAGGSPTVDGAGRGRQAGDALAVAEAAPGPSADDDALEAEPQWGPVGPYRGGQVHVLEAKCATCIFRPGNLMDLRPGRVEDMVATCQQRQGVITCHSTLDTDVPAVCRGFWDVYRRDIWPLRLAVALDVVAYDPVPVVKAGR